ncbi:MAG TPA: amidohydrolase [Fimbriimonadaceae bacterium]|nr:amidohydrolase [Fimbriimonadaceae bacterium]
MALKELTLDFDLSAITDIRHDLHAHPELMYQERRTSDVVQRELSQLGIEFKAGLAGGTGVLGYLPATHDPGAAPTVALRADMDALPILERTGLPYASTHEGVMHACGHDGHTSILIGTAQALKNAPERRNNVLFVFQPAEEGGAGGQKMCQDGVLQGKVIGPKADIIYGLHGWSVLTVGKVSTKPGPLMAAADSFDIHVKGAGCHAAYPHFGIDPIVVASHIVSALQTIASRNVAPLDSVVVTIGEIKAGSAHNIIPETAFLRGTLRTLKPETRAFGERRIREIADGIAKSFGAEATVDWHGGYPVTFNEKGATDRFFRLAKEAIGGDDVIEAELPTMGAEDFSYYGHEVPACFFWLGLLNEGQEKYPNLHSPEFDFNDKAIPLGVKLMSTMALAPL